MADRHPRHRAPGSALRKPLWWLTALAILGGIAAALYYYGRQPSQEQVQLPPPADEARPAAKVAAEATIRHPIPEAQPQFRPAEPLPTLDQRDNVLQGVLAELLRSKSLRELFYSSDIVRRFVVTVDNLPRKKLPLQLRPVKPAAVGLVTASENTGVVIASENDRRYASYVSAAEAVDSKKLVAVYVHFYPLFQQEYRALGYPSGAFNDRLIEAIDDLLVTPDVEDPIRLLQPKVMYEFADRDLEALSAGEKIMLRIGRDNAARISAKLREIRRELTASIVGDRGR